MNRYRNTSETPPLVNLEDRSRQIYRGLVLLACFIPLAFSLYLAYILLASFWDPTIYFEEYLVWGLIFLSSILAPAVVIFHGTAALATHRLIRGVRGTVLALCVGSPAIFWVLAMFFGYWTWNNVAESLAMWSAIAYSISLYVALIVAFGVFIRTRR